MKSMKVGLTGQANNRYSAGIARICLPINQDRDAYINEALKTGFVSILQEENGVITRVKCDKQTIQEINFPESSKRLGSLVVFLTIPKHKQPIIIACIDSLQEYSSLRENQFRLFRELGDSFVEIRGDAKGRLLVSVQGSNKTPGRIDIDVSDPQDNAQVNLNVKGQITINSTAQITQISESEYEIRVGESVLNVQDGTVQITSESIVHNEGSEPMVLGDTLAEKIDKILDILLNAKTSTSIGLQPFFPTTLQELQQLKSEINEIKSEKSKLE